MIMRMAMNPEIYFKNIIKINVKHPFLLVFTNYCKLSLQNTISIRLQNFNKNYLTSVALSDSMLSSLDMANSQITHCTLACGFTSVGLAIVS